MNRRLIKYSSLPVLLSTLLLSITAEAKIVCWTNSEGIRECGNSVPPEYAQKATRTLNKQGMTTEVRERAKTPEELAAERAKAAEEKRLAEEQEQQRQEQEHYDRVLLSTYLDEQDITRARDRQSASINGIIDITQATIDKLQVKLDAERKKAADYERQSKELPERIKEDIATLQRQIDEKQAYIQLKEGEKQALHDKFAADLARFRELKESGARLR